MADNRERLQDCPGPHEFIATAGILKRCRICGGTLPITEAEWYTAGLRHGRQEALRDIKSGRLVPEVEQR